ncbi:GNAT family protein [Aerococcus sp.]|uniref:GNAT family N-acetyltransferase n=1 Tax=Aerococcus sp. TaxID=1872398 RepID=UPI0028B11C71|nr:GNAT family protein [Aerococcus sp.]
MILSSDRLIFRAIEIEDLEVLLELINSPEIEPNVGGWSFPVSKENQQKWISNLPITDSTLRLMIIDAENNLSIGTVMLSNIDYKNGNAEIHLKLLSRIQGKGYGKESINRVLEYAFSELRLQCIFANVNEANSKSSNLFTKLNFKKEGILRNRIYKNGQYQNVVSFSIIKDEYYGNR